jgi:hypothetical protein
VSRSTSCWDFYEARLRKRQQLATENISSTNVAGSGTAAFVTVLEPLPPDRPKWDRRTVRSPDSIWPLLLPLAGEETARLTECSAPHDIDGRH